MMRKILLNINILENDIKNKTKRNPKNDTDQYYVITNIIRKIRKTLNIFYKKKSKIKDNIYNINRNHIDIYSHLYNNMDEYVLYKGINLGDIKIDSNKSRFELISKVFDILYI
jgi:hypothetical protein